MGEALGPYAKGTGAVRPARGRGPFPRGGPGVVRPAGLGKSLAYFDRLSGRAPGGDRRRPDRHLLGVRPLGTGDSPWPEDVAPEPFGAFGVNKPYCQKFRQGEESSMTKEAKQMISDQFRHWAYKDNITKVVNHDDGSQEFTTLREYAAEINAQLAPKGKHITFDLVDDPTVNGFATQAQNGEYLISVNRGAFDMRRQLNCNLPIPEFGPAAVASRCIIRYILGHELSHVVRGHVTNSPRPFCFNGSGPGALDEGSVMVEADADEMSGLTLAGQPLEYGGNPMPVEHRASFFLLSMQLLAENWHRSGDAESTHPHPYARYCLVRNGILEGHKRRKDRVDWPSCEQNAAEILVGTCGLGLSPADWIAGAEARYAEWEGKYRRGMAGITDALSSRF